MLKKLIIFYLVTGTLTIQAQQRPIYTQYMINKYNENPAYGGLERSLSVFGTIRDQNGTIPGNPRTFYAGADMPFYLWSGAIGFTVYHQTIGSFKNSNIRFSYNYVMGLDFGFLSFGGRVGMDFLNVDGRGIRTPDGSYEGVFNHNDPILGVNDFNGVGPSWELGSFFKGENIEAGITLAEFPTHGFTLGNTKYSKTWHASLYGSYKFYPMEGLELKPTMMIRMDRAVVQTDLGLLGEYNNILGGLNFRGFNAKSIDAIGLILGTNIGEKYRLYYSYDFGLSALRRAHQGSHELTLSYNMQKLIGIGLPPKIIYNPRDL